VSLRLLGGFEAAPGPTRALSNLLELQGTKGAARFATSVASIRRSVPPPMISIALSRQ